VTVDNTAPTGVNVTAPFSGQVVAGTALTVTGVATDPNMASVQFKLDGANLGALDTTAPYSVVWNTTTATQTSHTLTAVAKDLAGNTTTSASVTVIVDNTPPTGVFVTAPANGAIVSGLITVSGTASDANIKGVQFTVDGVNLGTLDKTVPYSTPWNTVPYPSGLHTLRAVAIDQAGNSTTSPAVTVTVNNNSDS
jgi:predicted 3-demethylubiquinone-9 3-methyltransferase (glyoxalase superfamily)